MSEEEDNAPVAPVPQWKSLREDFNQRFAQAAHNRMQVHGPAGLTPEGDPPPLDTSIPVVEPSQLARTPVFSKHVTGSKTVTDTAGKTPQSREESMNAEKAFQGAWSDFQKDFSQEPAESAQTAFGQPTTGAAETIRSTTSPVAAAWYKAQADNIGTRRMLGLANDDDLKELAELKKNYEKYAGAGSNVVGSALGGALPLAEQIAAGAALSFATRGFVRPQWGTALAAGMMAGGATFNRLKETRMTDGRPVDDATARGAALLVTALQGALFLGGEKTVAVGFKSLAAKFGIGKVATDGMAAMVERAATSPSFASKLAGIAAFELKGIGIVKMYGVLSDIAESFAQNAVSLTQEAMGEKAKLPMADASQLRNNILHQGLNVNSEGFDWKEFETQALTASFFIPFARPWLQARENAQAVEARNQTLPALEALAKGEAGKAPDHLREMVTDQQEAHDPDGPTQNVEIAAQRVREATEGAPLHPAVEERLQRAENGGGVAVIPVGEHTAYVLTQKGGDKLRPSTRIGEAPTIEEDPKVAEALQKAKEPNPIDVDTKKVANDISTKLSEEHTPEAADRAAEILSSFVRTTAIDRARSLGNEPEVFDVYEKAGPLEPAGNRDKALTTFQSGVEKLNTTVAREKRLAGAPGEKTPEKSKLERLQDLFRKSFGETALVFRVEPENPLHGMDGFDEGKAYLNVKDALLQAGNTGEKVIPVYVRPEDVTGTAGPYNQMVKTGPLDASRLRQMSKTELMQRFTREGKQATSEAISEPGARLQGFTIPGAGMHTVGLTGAGRPSTIFHEMGHYIEYFLKAYDPFKYDALFPEGSSVEKSEAFAESIEKYFKEGKAPNPGMTELYQHIARLMRSATHLSDAPLPEEQRNLIHRLFALQEEVEPMTRSLAPGAEHGILEPKDYLEYEQLQKDFEKETLEKVSKEAAKGESVGADNWVKAKGFQAVVTKALKRIQAFNLRVLSQRMGFKGDESKALLLAIENDAAETLRTATMRDLKPSAYYRAMVSQTKTMMQEWSRGNHREAYEAAAQVARARAMFEQVQDLKDNTEKRVEKAKTLATDDSIRGKIALGGKDYRVVMDWALQALGFEPKEFISQEALHAAVEALQEKEVPLPLPVGYDASWGLDGAPGGWKKLPSDQLHDALDMVHTAAYLGENANKVRIRGEKVDLTNHVTGLIDELRPVAEKKGLLRGFTTPPTKGLTPAEARESHPLRRARLRLNDVGLDFTKVEGESNIIDGKIAGPFHQDVYQPLADATFRIEKAWTPEQKAYYDRWNDPGSQTKEEYGKRIGETVYMPNADKTPIKVADVIRNIIGMLGDAGTRKRFLRGENLDWGPTIDWINGLIADGKILPEDIAKYHADQNQIDSHFEKAADLREAETGVRPPKVPAAPYMLQGKDGPVLVPGGYWPFKYDRSRAGPEYAHVEEARFDDIGDMDPFAYHARRSPGQDVSMVMERTASGLNLPLRLISQVVPNHIESVIRYNELYEPRQEVKKILTHPDMVNFLDENYRGAQKLFMDWQSILGSRGLAPDARGPLSLAKVARASRSMFTNYLLAGRFGSSIHILGSIFQGMNDAGALNIIKGATKITLSSAERARITGISDEVKTLSHTYDQAIMRHAEESFNAELVKNPKLIGQFGASVLEGYKQTYQKFALWAFKSMTAYAQKAVYAGAEYRADEISMKEGRALGSPDAEEFKKNFAENAVRNSHGASGPKDTARVFRDNNFFNAIFTPINSYRNSLFQHIRNMGYQIGRGEYGAASRNMLYNFMLPGMWSTTVRMGKTVLPIALGVGAAKALTDEERIRYLTSMLVHSAANQFLSAFPVAGEAAGGAAKKLEELITGERQDSATSFYGEPLAVPGTHFGERTYKDIKQWVDSGQIDWEDASQDAAEATGYIPYVPGHAVSSGMAWYYRMINDEVPWDEAALELLSPMTKRREK